MLNLFFGVWGLEFFEGLGFVGCRVECFVG